MATTSPDNLRTPDPGDPYNLVPDLATLAGDVQTALMTRSAFPGTAAARIAFTATAPDGFIWQDTDDIKMIWRKDGAVWVPTVSRWVGTSAQRIAFLSDAFTGFIWFDTDLDFEFIYQGGVWRANRSGEVLFSTASEAQTVPNGGWGTITGLSAIRRMYAGERAHIQVMGEVHNAGSGAAQQFGIRITVDGAAITPTRSNYYLVSTPGGNSYAIGVAIQAMYLSSTEANRNFVVQGIRSSAGAVGATLNFTATSVRKQHIS